MTATRIFNAIGWLATALVVASVAVRFFLPAQDRYAYYLAWGGLGLLLLYIASQWREIADFFTRRQARYGTLAASSLLIVLGILTAVNYIGKQQNKRWDLTAARQYSLSDQTRNVLAKLDAPMHIMVFAEEPNFQVYRDRLQEYEYSSSRITTEYVDPDRKPTVAQQHQIQQYGTLVVSYKGRTERTTQNTEQDITNTIIKVVTGEQKKLYFTQGHGEKNPTSTERDGFGTVAEALKAENYGVETLVLAQTGSVPADAAAVVVAGPKIDFFPQEIDALKAYLGKAGKVLLLLDPAEKADAAQTTNLGALAREWGIQVDDTIVVDVSGMGRLIGTDASVPVAANYPAHPITDRFNILTAYPLARAVSPVSGGVDGRTAQTFIESSPRSWAESDVKALLTSGEVSLDEGKDKQGPISLAAAVSAAQTEEKKDEEKKEEEAKAEEPDAPKPETRLAVVGDSDFASNGVLGIQGNRDLFMNIVGWLTQQENLISIRPKRADDRRITLTAAQQTNIMWLSLAVIPVAIFGTGVYTWWRRR
jgi:ABC-type uncharacterized transport system involved in gliding motility auxiliary subunit